MSEKVVLPNFDLPRDSTRVAMRVLWAMGGVVVLATLVLGLAMWHHRSLEIATAEQAAAKAEAARRAAMAPPRRPGAQGRREDHAAGWKRDHAGECRARLALRSAAATTAAPDARSSRSSSAQPPERQGGPRARDARRRCCSRRSTARARSLRPASLPGPPAAGRSPTTISSTACSRSSTAGAVRVGAPGPLSQSIGCARAIPMIRARAAFGDALNCSFRRAT